MTDQNITIENASVWHVCGLVLQCLPNKTSDICTALSALEQTEVPTFEKEIGKIVVVMQSHNPKFLFERMESLKKIQGVLDVALVYHQQDEQQK